VLVALAVLVVAVVTTVFATAAPASAHAVVVSSTPSDNEHLTSAPTEVTVVFSEPVSVELGGLTVLDSSGHRVDGGTTDQPQPTTLHTTLNGGLGDGTYLASYKLVSADGHPVSGAIVFTFGNAGATDVSHLIEQTSSSLDVASKVAQFLTYLGTLLAVGLAVFLSFVHDGADDARPLRRAAMVATLVGGFGIVLTIVVQGALVTNRSLTAAFDPAVLRPVLAQGLGLQSGVLLIGLALVYASVSVGRGVLAQSLSFYGGLTATASFVLWGHATESSNRWITIPADVVHVAMGALWFGGLVGVVLVLRRRPDGSESIGDASRVAPGTLAATVQVVQRFSTMAAGSVVLLTIAGSAIAYTELGSIDALTASDYGKLVLLKAGLVAVIVFTAGYNRYFLLPWLFDAHEGDDAVGLGDEPAQDTAGDLVDADAAPVARRPSSAPSADELDSGWRTLRTTVRLEAVLIVAVLAVTAVLVNTTPGGNIPVAPAGPFQSSKTFRTGTVALTVTPNQAGYNSFHVDLAGADGRPADLAQKMTLEVKLPAKDLGPLQREMIKGGTGHFIVENVPLLSIPGDWEITLVARVSDFEQERITFQDTVG
jgi:copper transport protein